MEGYYPPNQLPPQEQQRQQQNKLNHQHQQQQQQQPSPSMGMSRSNAFDGQMMGNPTLLQRRASASLGFGPRQLSDEVDARRMSLAADQGSMNPPAATGPGSFMGFQPSEQQLNNFSMLDTSSLGSMIPDGNHFPNLSPDAMRNLVSAQFADISMGAMFPNADPGSSTVLGGQTSPNAMQLSMSPNDAMQFNNAAQYNAFTDPQDSAVSATLQMNQLETGLNTTHDSRPGATAPAADPVIPLIPRHQSSTGPVVSPVQEKPSLPGMTQPSSVATTPNASASSKELRERSIYSKSGFDMLKALWLVASRKNPKIHLGAVDMSCAFVVCDVSMNDCPIIYVSDNFQNLTGYSSHDIVGQNCRFLQAPDGKVEAGTKREFVDNGAVFNLKKMIQERREVQQSLINYRKGGKPFLNLLTMIPIPWDTDEVRYFIGFQIDLVECPDAIAGSEFGGVAVNYKHTDIGQYIWTPPSSAFWEADNSQTLGVDDVSTILQQFNAKGIASDWHRQSWDKMLLENCDDVIHVLSLKGLFLYLSPACKRVLEYDATELVGNSLSSICHPSDIVPVTRELKDATTGDQVNIVFRIRRKQTGYTWFESHGSLYVEQGKGRKCIILVGRKRPVFSISRRNIESNGGIGDSEMWTKLSTSGTFLYVSSNVRSLLDLQPESLVATSIQELMRKDSRPEFGRTLEKARRGKIVTCKHEVLNRRGQGLQAQTTLYPGDATEGQKPSFLLAQTKLLKASSRALAPATSAGSTTSKSVHGQISQPGGGGLALGNQDEALASDDNIFDELRTTKCSSWQFELRQMEKVNRILAEELGGLLSSKKKRKRRKGVGNVIRDCANCHTRNTPEWRRGPSGQRDLCNSCGLRWAKQMGRVSPRNSVRNGDSQGRQSVSPIHSSPIHKDVPASANTSDNQAKRSVTTDAAATADATSPSAANQPASRATSAGTAMASIQEERETSST
uniref:Blue light receptor white collar 1 n=1 Tax=Cordyceps militaris TaxID=73501 RepID=R9UU91_CORMI|nr:blue light receptor white collar 1 [Cordyceps militaris]AGO64763.1 blue light receptor white collar 1 [Cordyceps militaris]